MRASVHLWITAALWAALFSLTGCATWTRIETPGMNGPGSRYTVEAPAGWVRADFLQDRILISKDGPGLNLIEVNHRKNGQAFVNTKVELTEDMLIGEVAEHYIAEYQTTAAGSQVNHLTTEPATVGGLPGFKVRFERINDKGLVFDVLVFGTRDSAYFYSLLYMAPRLYYYEKELEPFENLVASFKIHPAQKAQNP